MELLFMNVIRKLKRSFGKDMKPSNAFKMVEYRVTYFERVFPVHL